MEERSRFPIECRRIVVTLLLVATAGCAANVGPVGQPRFEAIVRQTVDLGEAEVLLSSAGRRLDQSWPAWQLLRQNNHRPAALVQEPGVIVLTDGALLFLEWVAESSTYREAERLGYDEIAYVESESMGGNYPNVVLETHAGENRFFVFGRGGGIDLQKHQQAVGILKQRARWRTLDDLAAGRFSTTD